MNLRKVRYVLMVVLFGSICVTSGYAIGKRQAGPVSIKGSAVTNVDTTVMNEVLKRLQSAYLKPEAIDSKKLMYGAAEGMTASLGDPYTAFYPPKENTRSKEDLSGEFGGVGITLGYIEKTLAVMSPLKGTPADKAGLRAGDLILKITDSKKGIDKDTSGITIEDAVDMIRGEKGTTVSLTMFREGDKQSKVVDLVRDVINVPSTELKWIDNGNVAVMIVNKFGDQTKAEWDKMTDEVIKKNAKGIILDLRNNPGGYLQRAVDLGSEFIKSGVIVKQRDRQNTQELNANGSPRLLGKPLVVLINKGSASASEILSGALRDRLGVKLVGENSFGKGTVQEVDELSNGAGLHVTIAEWLLPSGTNIHGVGLKPDVEVKYEFDEKNPLKDNQMDKALEVLKSLTTAKK